MTIAFVQEAPTQNTAAASHVVPISSGGGSCLVAVIAVRTGATQSVTGVSDDAGNTWTAGPIGLVSGSNTRLEIWYALNASAVTQVQVDLTNSLPATINILEFSGVLDASALDQSNSASNASTSTPTSGSVTTANADDVLVAAVSSTSTATLSSLTAGWNALTGFSGVGTTKQGMQNAYQIVNATGTYECIFTMSASQNWGGAILALKAAAAPAATRGYMTPNTHFWG